MINKYIENFRKECTRLLQEDYADQIQYDPKLLKKIYKLIWPYGFDDIHSTEFTVAGNRVIPFNRYERVLDGMNYQLNKYFTSPREQKFVEYWTSGDGLIGLLDYLWDHRKEIKQF